MEDEPEHIGAYNVWTPDVAVSGDDVSTKHIIICKSEGDDTEKYVAHIFFQFKTMVDGNETMETAIDELFNEIYKRVTKQLEQ